MLGRVRTSAGPGSRRCLHGRSARCRCKAPGDLHKLRRILARAAADRARPSGPRVPIRSHYCIRVSRLPRSDFRFGDKAIAPWPLVARSGCHGRSRALTRSAGAKNLSSAAGNLPKVLVEVISAPSAARGRRSRCPRQRRVPKCRGIRFKNTAPALAYHQPP